MKDRIAWNNRDASRWALERQIFETMAFYRGIQWIEYSETNRRFQRWNAPTWFPTPVTNYVKPRINLMIASLLKSTPQGRVRPNTNAPRDREAAKSAEKLIGHLYDVTHEDVLRQKAAQIACLGGTVIAEDYFDPSLGKILRLPQTQMVEKPAMAPAAVCATCDPPPPPQSPDLVGMPCPTCQQPLTEGEQPRLLSDGTPAMEGSVEPVAGPDGQPLVDEIPEGEIVSRVRMLFNFYWDPKATSLREAQWCGEAIYADLDWIDQHYPELGPYVAAESGIEANSFYESALLTLVGPSQQGAAFLGGQQHLQNGAILRKYQEKPSQQYPNGLYLVLANDVLLYPQPGPDGTYDHSLPIVDEDGRPTGDFSYTEFRYDELPGQFPGTTPGDDMVPLQRRVNAIDAHVVLNRKTLLSPWIIAPKGSGLNPGQVAMRPGAVVLYNSIGVPNAPQVVQGTALPAQVYQEREAAVQAMDDLARDAAQAANAQIPPGMRSGISMHFLKETQDEIMLPRLQRWGQWQAERDRKRLLLAQQHYREERAVKLLGQGSEYQVLALKGADIAGNVDISIDPGSLIPRSKSIQTQTIFDAIQQGLIDITNPIQRQKVLEEIDLEAYDTDVGPDWRRAEKENALMDEGEPVQITANEDSDTHFATHVARVKDPSFDSLSPMAQQAHLQHLQATQQAMVQAKAQAEDEQLATLRKQAELEAQMKAAGKGQVAPALPPPSSNGQSLATSGPSGNPTPPNGQDVSA